MSRQPWDELPVLTPAEAENAVRACSRDIHAHIHGDLKATAQKARDLRREYKLAYATEYIRAQEAGRPAHLCKVLAERNTIPAMKLADDAELLFNHAREVLDWLENDLSAHQSVLRSVMQSYGPLSSGVGR